MEYIVNKSLPRSVEEIKLIKVVTTIGNGTEAERKVNKFVLEIDGSHWEGTRKDLIRILNKYTGLVDSEEYPLNIRFMPFDQYKTMKHKKGQ